MPSVPIGAKIHERRPTYKLYGNYPVGPGKNWSLSLEEHNISVHGISAAQIPFIDPKLIAETAEASIRMTDLFDDLKQGRVGRHKCKISRSNDPTRAPHEYSPATSDY